jgi:uncharacterized protein (DUF2267 family)
VKFGASIAFRRRLFRLQSEKAKVRSHVNPTRNSLPATDTKWSLTLRSWDAWSRWVARAWRTRRIRKMDEAEVSAQWCEASRRYVSAINAHVERVLRDGAERAGPEPRDDREHLAEAVLAVVRRANASGETASLRQKFPPAWEPFQSILPEKGQWLMPMAWIDDSRIVLGVWSGRNSVVVVDGNDIVEQPSVRSFGRSPDGRFFALAFDDGVEVREGWNGPRVVWLSWPRAYPGHVYPYPACSK